MFKPITGNQTLVIGLEDLVKKGSSSRKYNQSNSTAGDGVWKTEEAEIYIFSTYKVSELIY